MSVYELRDFAIMLALMLTPTFAAIVLIRWLRPTCSARKAIVLSAAPLPALVALLCIALFVMAATTPRENCGVDACGMMMLAATFMFLYALAALGIGLLFAWLVCRLMRVGRRAEPLKLDDVFR